MKRWLQENIPALYLRYTTVMRYKAAAQKLRRIAVLDDPVPAAVVVVSPLEDTFVVEPPSDTTRNGQSADVAGDGDVRLRCGRNGVLDKKTGNGGIECQNGMSYDRTMEAGDALGLRCGRNQFTDMLDVQGEVGGVDACGGTGMTDVLDGTDGMDGHDGTGGVDSHDGAGVAVRNKRGMGAYAAAIVRARAVWRDVVADVAGHGPTALVARIDAYALQGRSV